MRTTTPTLYYDKTQLSKQIKTLVKQLENDYKARVCLTEQKELIEANSFHYITEILCLYKKDPICKLLYENFKNIELLSYNAGVIGFELFISCLCNPFFSYNFFLEQATQPETNNITKTEMIELVKQITKENEILTTCIFEALELAGLTGVIKFENGKEPEKYLVELTTGCNFSLKLYSEFLSSQEYKAPNCKILLVDGIVEKVSELENILIKNSENKEPLIVVAQMFSEEVIATLKCNLDNGKLNILPLILPQEIENINVLNDIGIVCGTDVVSCLKGEMISFVKYDDLKVVDEAVYNKTTQKLTINNKTTRGSVSLQIQSLLEKKQEGSRISDIETIYDRRIQNLLSRVVTIWLPKKLSEVENKKARILADLCLRNIKSAVSCGVVLQKDIPAFLLELPCLKKNKLVSSLSLTLATNCTKHILELLNSCGGLIQKEEL